jgi:hypothetical protein
VHTKRHNDSSRQKVNKYQVKTNRGGLDNKKKKKKKKKKKHATRTNRFHPQLEQSLINVRIRFFQ